MADASPVTASARCGSTQGSVVVVQSSRRGASFPDLCRAAARAFVRSFTRALSPFGSRAILPCRAREHRRRAPAPFQEASRRPAVSRFSRWGRESISNARAGSAFSCRPMCLRRRRRRPLQSAETARDPTSRRRASRAPKAPPGAAAERNRATAPRAAPGPTPPRPILTRPYPRTAPP